MKAKERKLEKTQKETSRYKNYRLNVCIDYGGRDEIVRAIKAIVGQGIKEEDVNQKLINSFMDTRNSLPLDYIIRTSGENRLSGFMPWASVYSELYFEKDYFPDFSPEKLHIALLEYSK